MTGTFKINYGRVKEWWLPCQLRNCVLPNNLLPNYSMFCTQTANAEYQNRYLNSVYEGKQLNRYQTDKLRNWDLNHTSLNIYKEPCAYYA